MKSSFDIFIILIAIGAAQGILIATALLTMRRGNRTANRILAIFLIALSIDLSYGILIYTRLIVDYPNLIRLNNPLVFIYGPLLFFYVKALTSDNYHFKNKDLLHFIPVFVFILYWFPFYFENRDHKVNYVIRFLEDLPPESYVIGGLRRLQHMIYIILLARLLIMHSQKIKDYFSSIEKINLNWLSGVVIGFTCLWVIDVYRYIFDFRLPLGLATVYLAAFFMFIIGFMGLRQPEIFTGREDSQSTQKYATSSLTPEKADQYLDKLLEVMEIEKPFIDSTITLPKLAKQILVTPHHLSQILNEKLHQSFFDFINRYRIEEAKKRLVNPENEDLGITEIAYQVGYNSTSPFNTAFKKHAKTTPSQYRKTLNDQNN